jgi:hypothetical protein
MKKVFSIGTALLLSIAIFSSPGCKKKKEDTKECKTCKAIGGIDNGTVTEQVCSDQAEQDFRNKHAGQTVTCQ